MRKEINLPKEARQSFFVFFMLLNYMYKLFTYVQISSMSWAAGRSVGQLLPDPDGRALNQPKPHPSSKTV